MSTPQEPGRPQEGTAPGAPASEQRATPGGAASPWTPGGPFPHQSPGGGPGPQWQGHPAQPGYPWPPQGYPATPSGGSPHPGYAGHTAPGTRYGAPGSTYGGFGAFGEAAKPKRSRKPWLVGAAVVVVLGGGAGAAWLLGAFKGDRLDQQSVQDGVQKVLHEDFGESDVKNVNCPKDQTIRTGTTFDCTVTVAGQPKKVTVRVLNDQAQYEVGAPK